ncbi:MAG: HAMP domain-containing protein, partial [Chloroflexi bacterium]|nr:HAMP domain-containing protein [Chloroflexota bacterium]
MTFLPIPSLRWRLVIVMCVAYTIVSIATLLVGYSDQLRTVHRQQETRARSDAQILASGAVAPLRSSSQGGLNGIRALVASLRGADGVSYAAIIANTGCVIASTRAGQEGTCPHFRFVPQPIDRRLSNGDVVGFAPISFETSYAGAAEVVISGSVVQNDLIANTVTNGLLRLIGLVMFLVLSLATAQYILGPLANLARGSEAIRAGEFSTRVPVQGGTELRSVGEAFNEMAISLERRVRHLTFLASSGPVLPGTLREHGDVRFALDEFCGQVEACAVGLFPSDESGQMPLWYQVDPDDAEPPLRAEGAAA